MRFWTICLLAAAGIAVGSAIGAAAGLIDDSSSDKATTASLVDVTACPGATGALGQLKRGMPVLITAVHPTGDFYEISYPLSPNGRGWLPAAEVETEADPTRMERRVCLPIISNSQPGAGAGIQPSPGTATPTSTSAATPTPAPTSTRAATSTQAPSSTPAPTETAPPPSPTATPAQATPTSTATPSDSLPPEIAQGAVMPSEINGPNLQQKCPPRAAVVQVSALVTDNVGVVDVTVGYSAKTSDGKDAATMTLSGGVYAAVIGPFSPVQDLEVVFTVSARDLAGNQASLEVGKTALYVCQ